MRALIVALALAGCASADGAGVTSSRDGMSWVDAAPMGDGVWLVSCDNRASYCTDRAAKLCPSGFDVTDMAGTSQISAAIGPYGGGFGSREKIRLKVTCKS